MLATPTDMECHCPWPQCHPPTTAVVTHVCTTWHGSPNHTSTQQISHLLAP